MVRPLVGGGAYYGPRPHTGGYSYAFFVLAAFVPYGVALWAVRRPNGASLRAVVWAVVAVWLVLLAAPLIQSQDLFQYLFYGHMQVAHGANPYVTPPDTFAADPWFRWIAWPAQRSVYGPLWTGAIALVVRAATGSPVRAMLLAKVFAVGLGALAGLGLARLVSSGHPGAEGDRRAAVALVAFMLNPLVLSAVPLSGHADAAVAAAFVWAMVADRRGLTTLSALLLATASLVKVYAVVALAAYLLAVRRRDGGRVASNAGIAAGVLILVAFVPYWTGPSTFGGLASIARDSSASLGGAVVSVATSALSAVGVHDAGHVASVGVRVVGVAVVLAVLWHLGSGRRAPDPWRAALLTTLVYLSVAPWFLPWHALGALALASALSADALADASLTFSASCWGFVHGPGALGSVATAAARYGPPAIASRGRRPTGRRHRESGLDPA